MIDFALDLISFGLRYGLSWLTLGLAVLALFKSRKLRKRFNKYLPPMLRDEQDSEVSKYIRNQQRIENKLDLLLEERGITWNVDMSNTLEPKHQMSLFKFSILSRAAQSTALYVIKHMKWRKQKMKNFLTGKKKWLAFLIAVAVNGLNETLGLGIDADTVSNITTGATGYIVVEGVLDFTRSLTDYFKSKETKTFQSDGEKFH